MAKTKKNPNLELLTTAVEAIGPLRDKVAFVGGATTILHITGEMSGLRTTVDVDAVIDTKSLHDFYALEEQLRKLGFENDPDLTCRFRKGDLIIDFMPTDPSILGFSNRWYVSGLKSATEKMVDKYKIRVFDFPHFVATKLEAFNGRGNGDYYGSKDIEDLVTVFAGRRGFLLELLAVEGPLGAFIRSEIKRHLRESEFLSSIEGNVPRDATTSHERIIADLRELAER